MFSFICLRSLPSLTALLPTNSRFADLDLRALVDVEGQVHQLRPARDLLDRRLDLREHVALLRVDLAHDAGDAADEPRIDERIEIQADAALLQLLVDLPLVDLARIRRSRRS